VNSVPFPEWIAKGGPDLSSVVRTFRQQGWLDPLLGVHFGGLMLQKKNRDNRSSEAWLAASLLQQVIAILPFGAEALDRLDVAPQQPGGVLSLLREHREEVRAASIGRDAVRRILGVSDQATLEEIALGNSGLGWRYVALLGLWRTGEGERFLVGARRLMEDPLARGLCAPMLAWGFFAAGDIDSALHALEHCPDSPLSWNLKAELALLDHDQERARSCYLRSLAVQPGQPHLVYRLWELNRLHVGQCLADNHHVQVLFYTFNKLEPTLQTLESLLSSRTGDAGITLLNNGSTSFSPLELEQRVAATARGREVRVVHLPVNIGAPAARNWLWHLPEVRRAAYVAFLDDDVLLPPDWLECYLQDMKDFPGTAVVGPLGLDPGSMPAIQYVDRYFQEIGEHKIRFTHNAPFPWDLGQFSLRRPCLSVMGCCHLFDRKLCDRLGIPDFDIRFSPSQVDDLDHDLQIWKRGGKILYDGRVRVVHLQHAGKSAPLTRASWGHVWGNHMKMESKYSRSDLEDIHRKVLFEERSHWERCLEAVSPDLPPEAKEFMAVLSRYEGHCESP
jgi:GT2 family glycosyltransferase